MDKTLRTIEEELNWLIKDHKATTDYKSTKYIDTLDYHIIYSKKNIKLTFQFSLMPREKSLSMNIIYNIRDSEKNYKTFEYPLSKIRTDLDLPMISDFDTQRIYDAMDFQVVDGKIISNVSQLTQGLTFTEVIRRNIDDLINHGKELRKQI